MTTAARGTEDDDIRTMEPVEPARRKAKDTDRAAGPSSARPRFGDSALARGLFIGLAIVAGLALIAAIVIVLMAPAKAATLLTIALVTLVVVVVAEIVLLIVARPRKA